MAETTIEWTATYHDDGTISPTWNRRQMAEEDDWEHTVYRAGKKAAGRLLDDREWNEFPLAHPAERAI